MEQKQGRNRKVWIVTVCVLLVAAAMFGVYQLAFGNRDEGAKAVRVQVVLPDGSQSYDETLHTDAQTLSELLNENQLATMEQSTYGSFITGVNGVMADSENSSGGTSPRTAPTHRWARIRWPLPMATPSC